MTTERKARELLAEEYERHGAVVSAHCLRDGEPLSDAWEMAAINAITRALESAGQGEALSPGGTVEATRDDELPGMWSASDFTGSDPDERSYAEAVGPKEDEDLRPEAQAGSHNHHVAGCGIGREAKMVAITDGVFCDPCIAPIVKALNDAGLRTVASCCGHEHRPGVISLADGRELVIARNYSEARRIDALFPVDINGEAQAGGAVEPDCECVESDGCPTEGAVLKRFWRSHQPDPKLCEFYGVKTMAELLSAQEDHILKLQDSARRNVKPWEDTFPPTLLPKYLRDSGLAAAEPATRTVIVHTATTPPAKVPEGMVRVEVAVVSDLMDALHSFAATAEDDECYTVSSELMSRLAMLGAVYRAKREGWYYLTDFGRMLLAAAPAPKEGV